MTMYNTILCKVHVSVTVNSKKPCDKIYYKVKPNDKIHYYLKCLALSVEF